MNNDSLPHLSQLFEDRARELESFDVPSEYFPIVHYLKSLAALDREAASAARDIEQAGSPN